MVSLSNTVSIYNANNPDVTKYIRQNISTPAQVAAVNEKVKSRSHTLFSTYRGKETWKEHFSRRKQQARCGFFSVDDQPYRECGRVELDTRNLVVNTLEKVGNVFSVVSKPHLSADIEGQQQEEEDRGNTTLRANVEIPVDRPHTVDNGIKSIKELIEQAEKRIVSIKAGQSLAIYLRREREEKELRRLALEQENNTLDMVLIDVEEPLKKDLRPTSAEDEMDEEEVVFECKSRRYFLDKLDCLHTLFISISNMKVKDLRTKTPLSKEALKNLQAGLFIDSQGTFNAPRHHRNSVVISNMRDIDLQYKRLNIDSGTGVKMPTSVHPVMSSRSDLNSPDERRRKKTVAPLFFPKHSPLLQSQRGVRVDNWEELLAVGSSMPHHPTESQVLDTDHVRTTSRVSVQTIKYLPINKRRLHGFQQFRQTVSTEQIPLWQKILQETKDGVGKDSNQAKKRQRDALDPRSKRHEVLVENLKNSFDNTKSMSGEQVRKDIDGRIDSFKRRLELVKLKHLREEDLPKMRSQVNQWKKEVSLSRAGPPEWYCILRKEQKNSQLEDDEECEEKFKKLDSFSHGDMSSTSVPKAKLCLLVFSLPVYELCTVPMQDAASFFLSKVIECSNDPLTEWMQTRKLITGPKHD